MLPSASMMNPLPAPRRGDSRSRGVPKSYGPSYGSDGSAGRAPPRRRREPLLLAVVSMFTTAGFSRSTTSAKFTRDGIAGPAGPRAGRLTGAGLSATPAVTAERATPPARIAPTRKATTAVRATVTRVNRRDISGSIISAQERQKLCLVHPLDAQLLRLLQFAARLGAEHHAR